MFYDTTIGGSISSGRGDSRGEGGRGGMKFATDCVEKDRLQSCRSGEAPQQSPSGWGTNGCCSA